MQIMDNHDVINEWVTLPSDRPHWALTITLGFLLGLVLWTVAPVQAEPSPVTKDVAHALGWCEVKEK